MPEVDMAVLTDGPRLAAVRRARRVLPGLPMPLDAIARLAARTLGAPIAIVALMEVEHEHFIGSYGLPPALSAGKPVPAAYSVCKYVVCADHPVIVDDMAVDPDLAGHALAVEYGARAFAGVPLRDAADHTIGSLLVVDTVAHRFTDADMTMLVEISALLAGLENGDLAVPADGLDGAAVLDGVQEAFIAVDAAGLVAGWNPAATRMLGWSADEVRGRVLAELILPDVQRDRLREVLPELAVANGPGAGRSVRTEVRHRDGHRLAVRATLSSLRGKDGPLICAFLIDVTDQSEAERDARVQRGFLHAMLDSLDTGVVAIDGSGRPIVCNRALRRMHGIEDDWTAERLWAMYAERVRRPDGAVLPLEVSPLSRALRGETIRDEEVLIRIPGERDHLFLGNAQPVVGPDGHRLGAVLALHEITEQRRVERFHECQLAVADALTATGSPATAAPAVTRAVATALDWPYVELRLINEITGALQPAGSHGGAGMPAGRKIIKGGGVTGSVWATAAPLAVADLLDTGHLPAGARSDADEYLRAGLRTVIALPIVAADHLVGVLTCAAEGPEHGLTRTVTLLGGIAEQLGQFSAKLTAERLGVEVARSRNDFLTLVGHEMRTPLTSIASAVDMVIEEIGPAGDLRHLMLGVARNTAILCAIVDELLDLAGLELGHQSLTERSIDLAEIAREAVRDAQSSAENITVIARIAGEVRTVGDPFRLRQVLDNLLSNAVKYSSVGGLVRLSLEHDAEIVTITVTDSGIGIPVDERDHVFERFYRATNVRHHGVPGTGLGLPLVRAIVEAHHGTITLSDPATEGTTVTVQLPVA